MKDSLDPSRTVWLVILKPVEIDHPLLHRRLFDSHVQCEPVGLKNTWAIQSGQQEQANKRPKREPEARVDQSDDTAQICAW